MTTKYDPAPPRRGSSVADLAVSAVSLDVARRTHQLRAEAQVRHAFRPLRRSVRARIGLAIVRLGQAISGAELQTQPAGQRAS